MLTAKLCTIVKRKIFRITLYITMYKQKKFHQSITNCSRSVILDYYVNITTYIYIQIQGKRYIHRQNIFIIILILFQNSCYNGHIYPRGRRVSGVGTQPSLSCFKMVKLFLIIFDNCINIFNVINGRIQITIIFLSIDCLILSYGNNIVTPNNNIF